MNEVGKTYERPWGTYKTIEQINNYQVKHITVYPEKRLSLQYHSHRNEYWTVVKGEGVAQLDDKIIKMSIGDFIVIPKLSKHRMTNQSKSENLEFIEIQVGNYLGEDDIVRIEDDFDRM